MKVKLTLILILIFLAGCAGKTSFPVGVTRLDSCLSGDEAELAKLINKERGARGMPVLPVTISLQTVAKWHVIDLSLHEPHINKTDDRGKPCTLRSWSAMGPGRGEWSPVCYTADHQYARGMWNKPIEIAGYPADGYEGIYSAVAPLIPASIAGKWSNEPATADLIYEQGHWKNSNWQSMGIAIKGAYASIWLGSLADDKGVSTECRQ